MSLKNAMKSSDMETRTRLLDAAGEVFAEKGFRDATVRDICRRAKANVAAVNYHFHDKAGLYSAVVKYAHRCACEKFGPQPESLSGKTPEEQLAAFIRARLHLMFDAGRPTWHGKLMSREMIEPTQALDQLVEEEMRPRAKQLHDIVKALLGPAARDEQIRLTGLSIVAQCVFYHHARAVVTRLYPSMKFDSQEIEHLAEHITQFSLAALKQLRRQKDRS